LLPVEREWQDAAGLAVTTTVAVDHFEQGVLEDPLVGLHDQLPEICGHHSLTPSVSGWAGDSYPLNPTGIPVAYSGNYRQFSKLAYCVLPEHSLPEFCRKSSQAAPAP
jgi:hypothetical protein